MNVVSLRKFALTINKKEERKKKKLEGKDECKKRMERTIQGKRKKSRQLVNWKINIRKVLYMLDV